METIDEKTVSCYMQNGEKSLSTTLPVLPVPAVTPLHTETYNSKSWGSVTMLITSVGQNLLNTSYLKQ